MQKPKKHGKPREDENQLAHRLVEESTDEHLPTKAQISLLMADLGRKGGKIGGKRRLQTMTSEERSIVARNAAHARWSAKSKKA